MAWGNNIFVQVWNAILKEDIILHIYWKNFFPLHKKITNHLIPGKNGTVSDNLIAVGLYPLVDCISPFVTIPPNIHKCHVYAG